MKGFGVIFVVFSHVQSPQLYARFYIPVLLSSFFFAAGYTFNCRENFRVFLNHKAATILWPFAIFGLCKAVLAIIVEGDAITDRLLFLISIRGVWDDLWFIMCLFTCEVLFYPFVAWRQQKKSRNKDLLLALVLVFIAAMSLCYTRAVNIPLPFQFENACIALPHILMGYLYRQYENESRKLKTLKNWGWMAIPIYIVVVMLFQNGVDIHKAQYDIWSLYMLSSITGLILLIFVSKKLENHRNNDLLLFWGRNSLVIYIVQGYCIKVCQIILNRMPFNMSPYVQAPIIAVATLLMTSVIALIINRYFGFMLRFPRRSIAK